MWYTPAMNRPELKRALGLPSAVFLIVGSVIGSGVFLKPLRLAEVLPSEGWIYATWIGVGVVCFAAALAFAELGAMMPTAGGPYTYLRAAFGPFVAFLYGWCLFFVINPGTIAALAVVFGERVAEFFGLGAGMDLNLALAMIVGLALVNHVGVVAGTWLQNVSTIAKLGILGGIVVGGLLALGGEPAATAATTVPSSNPSLTKGLGIAAIAVFWAYEGWHQFAFSAAELKNPRRDIPLAVLIGMSILIAGYTLVNAAYLAVVPLGEMKAMVAISGTEPSWVAETFLTRVFGAPVGNAFVLLLALSVLGAANPNFLSTSRSFLAMAEEGELPRLFARISPRFRTPVASIWAQAVLSIGLVVVLREFHDLTDYVVTVALLFFAAAVAAAWVLRVRNPNAERPYRCPWLPLCVVLFAAATLFVEFEILTDPEGQQRALYAAGFAGLGALFYALRRGATPKKV